MGLSISWLAFKGIDRDSGLARLNLEPTAETAALYDSDLAGGELPDGWYLVVADECDGEIISAETLSRLTVDGEAVAGSVEEHVMYSAAEHWRNGRRLWRIAHESEKARRHIELEGAAPAQYDSTVAEMQAAQDAEDAGPGEVDHYFEIPLTVAKSIAGFKHDDESQGVDDEHMTVLAKIGGARQAAWWQFWK